MGKITKEELSSSLNDHIDSQGDDKQDEIDSNLQTSDKTIVGAINELYQNINDGKALIANAIGEPLTDEDSFTTMSNGINSLTSLLKTNLTNAGVDVNDEDKLKSLISKVKGIVKENTSKGIKFAEGTGSWNVSSSVTISSPDLDFIPDIIICHFESLTQTSYYYGNYTAENTTSYRAYITNTSPLINTYNSASKLYISDIELGSFKLKMDSVNENSSYGNYWYISGKCIGWYAIGLDEENNNNNNNNGKLKFASGNMNTFSFSKNYQTLNFDANIGFVPTHFFVYFPQIHDQYNGYTYYNVSISNIESNVSKTAQMNNTKLSILNLSDTGFSIQGSQGASNETMYSPSFYNGTWYAIGESEEDTKLTMVAGTSGNYLMTYFNKNICIVNVGTGSCTGTMEFDDTKFYIKSLSLTFTGDDNPVNVRYTIQHKRNGAVLSTIASGESGDSGTFTRTYIIEDVKNGDEFVLSAYGTGSYYNVGRYFYIKGTAILSI